MGIISPYYTGWSRVMSPSKNKLGRITTIPIIPICSTGLDSWGEKEGEEKEEKVDFNLENPLNMSFLNGHRFVINLAQFGIFCLCFAFLDFFFFPHTENIAQWIQKSSKTSLSFCEHTNALHTGLHLTNFSLWSRIKATIWIWRQMV